MTTAMVFVAAMLLIGVVLRNGSDFFAGFTFPRP